MGRGVDLANKRFGRLVAIRPTDERRGTSIVWECMCDCGRTAYISAKLLRHTELKSCGCYRKERTKVMGKRNKVSEKSKSKKMKPSNNLEAEIVAKKRELDEQKEYRFEYSKCEKPVIGRLVNEYQKTAAFEVLRAGCDEDRAVLRQLNNRVLVSKKAVVAI